MAPQEISPQQAQELWQNTLEHFDNANYWNTIMELDPQLNELTKYIQEQNTFDNQHIPFNSKKPELLDNITHRLSSLIDLARYSIIYDDIPTHSEQHLAVIHNVLDTIVNVPTSPRYLIEPGDNSSLTFMLDDIIQHKNKLTPKLPWDRIVPELIDNLQANKLFEDGLEQLRLKVLLNAPSSIIKIALEKENEYQTTIISQLNSIQLLSSLTDIPPEVNTDITMLLSHIPEKNVTMITSAFIWLVRMQRRYIYEPNTDMFENLKYLNAVVRMIWDTLNPEDKAKFIDNDIMSELNGLYNDAYPTGPTVLGFTESLFTKITQEYAKNGAELAYHLIEILKKDPTARFSAFEKFFPEENRLIVEKSRPFYGKIGKKAGEIFRRQ